MVECAASAATGSSARCQIFSYRSRLPVTVNINININFLRYFDCLFYSIPLLCTSRYMHQFQYKHSPSFSMVSRFPLSADTLFPNSYTFMQIWVCVCVCVCVFLTLSYFIFRIFFLIKMNACVCEHAFIEQIICLSSKPSKLSLFLPSLKESVDRIQRH